MARAGRRLLPTAGRACPLRGARPQPPAPPGPHLTTRTAFVPPGWPPEASRPRHSVSRGPGQVWVLLGPPTKPGLEKGSGQDARGTG